MKRTLEVMRAAAWLGWQVEANWADPFVFFVFSIVKPLATTLILFIMVRVVSQGQATADTFLFLFLGNTFFLYVSEVLIGVSWSVFRDREDYETLKYIYTAPLRFLAYLLGRGATKMATATIGVVVALLFGKVVLGLPIGPSAMSWSLLALATALGLVSVAWLGIILAGASLIVARHSINMNEGLSGLFYLLSGTVFPIQVLPGWAQKVSLLLPFTYWLELIRRIVTGRTFAAPLLRYSDGQLWMILALATAGTSIVAVLWFRMCEHTARARGLIDMKTNY
jgi:ABC-2 type transport system permease protein